MNQNTPGHMLIFEPRSDGHHLSWLRLITEGFLSIGMELTLALDTRPDAMERIQAALGDAAERTRRLPVFDEAGHYRRKGALGTIALLLGESGADEVFLPNLDEIASDCLRRAAFGLYPPPATRGRLSGVYHRPRSLAAPSRPLGNRIKTAGLRRLGRNGWCRNLFLVDEYLLRTVRNDYPGLALSFVPTPGLGDFSCTREAARRALGLPDDRFIFLNYGIPSRRKGLHLAVRVMLEMPADSAAFLFCAGRTAQEREIADGLATLEQRGQALSMGRYISGHEEQLSFCACDAVLLPYLGHMGSSAVLSQAAAAGKPVIASDEYLVAKRVREHHLGLLFPSGDNAALKAAMERMAGLPEAESQGYREAARAYAETLTAEAFKAALVAPYAAD